MVATARSLDLHRAEDPAQRRIERVLGGLDLDRLPREAQRRHVLLVDEQVRRVRDRLDLVRAP